MNRSSEMRRNSSSRNRRRRRRAEAGATGNGQHGNARSDDIVEQLRRQRQKQNQQEQLDELTVPTTPSDHLGKFQYCARCCAYFPRGTHAHPRENRTSSQPTDNSTPPRFRSSPFLTMFPSFPTVDAVRHSSSLLDFPLATASFLAGNSRSRQALVERWRFDLWSKSSCTVSSCVSSFPTSDSYWYVDDSVPWNRSFDVIPGIDADTFPTFVSCRPDPRCKLANHAGIRELEDQGLVATIHTVRRLRNVRQAGEDTLRFGMIVSLRYSSETIMKWYRLSSLSICGAELPRTTRIGDISNGGLWPAARWNDFCSTLDGRRMILIGESRARGGDRGPWVAEFDPEQGEHAHFLLRSSSLASATSNRLCVEAFDDHTYCLGHANGTVTLWDDRVGLNGTATLSTNMRNVIRLLPQDSSHILVRGGGAMCDTNEARQEAPPLCQLWDVRNLSHATLCFALPPCQNSQASTGATFRSNGMATDPGRTVLMTPWIEQCNGYQCPRLGVWGLHSGDYLGSRNLDGAVPSQTTAQPRLPSQVVAEISDCVTSGWKKAVTSNGSLSTTSVSRRNGAVGIWYRVHERRGEKTSSSSIHHLAFEGKVEPYVHFVQS